jgi:hypothetical protein
MTSIATCGLITAATIFNGVLAGGNIDRALVQMPAWRKVGARAWAAYSRHADLENGFYLYPTEAIGGALFTIAAAVSFRFDVTAPAPAALPVYLSVALVIGGLLATVKAAPLMMSLRCVDDILALQKAFDGFRRWGNMRGAFQILAFLANVWALVAVLIYIH